MQLVNTNKLVRNYEGCTGLKTGSTSVALFNLSASATRNGLSLIAVIMRAETSKIRFSEAGLKSEVNAVYENDYGCVLKKSDKKQIEPNIEIYKNVYAPIKKRRSYW